MFLDMWDKISNKLYVIQRVNEDTYSKLLLQSLCKILLSHSQCGDASVVKYYLTLTVNQIMVGTSYIS